MVLHLVIMVFCITVLSGMYFTYDTPNTNNEVLILVDMSYSNSDNSDMKDDFVKSVILIKRNYVICISIYMFYITFGGEI